MAGEPARPLGPEHSMLGRVILGKYRLDRVLGQGGTGIVFLGWQAALHQHVAIKLLRPEAASRSEVVARFRREARIAAKFHSRHVARIIEVGTLDGATPYIVMEYLQGRDLAEELKLRCPLPIAEAVGYAVQALDAIAESHWRGVVHRDLKPANLFLAEKDGQTCIKVLDFGISKLTSTESDTAMTSTRSLVGSPLYMSPEQIRAPRSVDARSDIWSIGAVLHEMLAGAPPFPGDTVGEVFAGILTGDVPRLRSLRPHIPELLEATILRCLSKEPEQRYQNVGRLISDLAPFAGPECKVVVQHALSLVERSSTSPKRSGASDASQSYELAASIGDAGGRGTSESLITTLLVAGSPRAETARGPEPQPAITSRMVQDPEQTAFWPAKAEPRVKGVAFRTIDRVFEQLRGERAQQRARDLMRPELAHAYRYGLVLAASWYPITWYCEAFAAFRAVTHEGVELAHQIGRFGIQHDMSGVYKSLLDLLTSPQAVLDAAQLVFNKFYGTGKVEILESITGRAQVLCSECFGWDENMWSELTGRWITLLEFAGARQVRLRVISGGGDDIECDMDIRWSRG